MLYMKYQKIVVEAKSKYFSLSVLSVNKQNL